MKQIIQCLLLLIFSGSINLSYAQESIPDINKRIITYLESNIGETVGHGECWDLADQALTSAGAQFDKSSQKTIYIFGKMYNHDVDNILPGDILQFEGVTVSYKNGNMSFTENYKHHTAIVYRINSDKSLQLAHQNTSFGGRKVALNDFNLQNVKKGKIYFYHPIDE